MKRIYQMYKFAKFINEQNTYAENNRDESGRILYPKAEDLIKDYAEKKGLPESVAAHLRNSCIDNGYLYESRHSSGVFLDDGKGAKLLDSLLGVPFGLIEELLRQYSYSVTLFSGAAFLTLVVAFWHVIKSTLHYVWPHLL